MHRPETEPAVEEVPGTRPGTAEPADGAGGDLCPTQNVCPRASARKTKITNEIAIPRTPSNSHPPFTLEPRPFPHAGGDDRQDSG